MRIYIYVYICIYYIYIYNHFTPLKNAKNRWAPQESGRGWKLRGTAWNKPGEQVRDSWVVPCIDYKS